MECYTSPLPDPTLAFTNCGFLSVPTWNKLREIYESTTGKEAPTRGINVIINQGVVCVREKKGLQDGYLYMGEVHRRATTTRKDVPVMLQPFREPESFFIAAEIGVTMDVIQAPTGVDSVDATALREEVQNQLREQVLKVGQTFVTSHDGIAFRFLVNKIVSVEEEIDEDSNEPSTPARKPKPLIPGVKLGKATKGTTFSFQRSPRCHIKIVGSSSGKATRLFNTEINFEKLGIGGLDREVMTMFRRAFVPRCFPPEVLRQMRMNFVRGVLLYGPPGCGKTLIARQISKALNAKEPKMVNGPEVLNKYVGETEKNIRLLFEDAEKEQAEKGDDSDLHVIIFDEIDAICRRRGTTSGGTGVEDRIVNQLLSKMDGVDQLNNILVIGMTNRKDIIDEALLRPGRFEIHIEIGLPDEAGRLQILNIHTEGMREGGYLSQDVNLEELSAELKNYTGAEIKGLVTSAASFAFGREMDTHQIGKLKEKLNVVVTREDFDRAMREVQPAFGAKDEELRAYARGGLIPYGTHFTHFRDILRRAVSQVRTSEKTPILSILLEGSPGSGKTALSAMAGVESGFPLVKRLGADTLIELSESGKASEIATAFNDAYRSDLSMLILDDIERIMEYVRIGPRFYNKVLQTLLVLVKKLPPKGKRLLVIGTTSEPTVLEDMGLRQVFNIHVDVPMLEDPNHVLAVLNDIGSVAAGDTEKIANHFQRPIAIKNLLMVLEMARQGERLEDDLEGTEEAGSSSGGGGGGGGGGSTKLVTYDDFIVALQDCNV